MRRAHAWLFVGLFGLKGDRERHEKDTLRVDKGLDTGILKLRSVLALGPGPKKVTIDPLDPRQRAGVG